MRIYCYTRCVALVSTLSLVQPVSLFAQEVDSRSVPGMIADGKPWNAKMGDGHFAVITLNADRTGRFEGPVKRNVTWEIKEKMFCIHIGFPAGMKCVTVRKVEGGFDFYKDGRKDLSLRR